MELAEVDLTDHARFAERVPHEMFEVLRREDPVHWQEEADGRGFWAITRHADITAVAKDWRTFSSELGGTSLEDLGPDELEARKSMLDMDPPPHNKLRAIVNRDFTPRAVQIFSERIRELFDEGARTTRWRKVRSSSSPTSPRSCRCGCSRRCSALPSRTTGCWSRSATGCWARTIPSTRSTPRSPPPTVICRSRTRPRWRCSSTDASWRMNGANARARTSSPSWSRPISTGAS